jgi:uncharacterized protein
MWDRVVVDSVAFARDASELRATVAIADLPRLHDMLYDHSGEIAYSLTGAVNKDGIGSLRLGIAAEVLMTCQHCLGPVKFSMTSVRTFELIPEGQELGDPAEEADDIERIHADARLDVTGLVEDEAILCLPMVAGHPRGSCSAPVLAGGKSEKKSPFSALAMLKRR